MEDKNSFVFYRSFYAAISKVKDKETKANIYDAICELGLNDNTVELDDSVGQIIMDLIRPQLQANNKKYEDGKKGGRPPKETTGSKSKKTTGYSRKKPNENVNVNENENVNDNDIFISTTTTNKNNNCLVVVEKEFGRTLSSTEIVKIIDLEEEFGTEKVILAIQECCLNQVKTIPYLKGILNNWKDKTIEEIKNNDNKDKNKVSAISEEEQRIIDYNWIDEE